MFTILILLHPFTINLIQFLSVFNKPNRRGTETQRVIWETAINTGNWHKEISHHQIRDQQFFMVTVASYCKLALSFPETEELPHFERRSFRVKKKIFTTLQEKTQIVMVKLSPVDQSVFCAYDKTIIYPVPGFWGRGGATYIELKKVSKSMLKDALTTAWCTVAPKKMVDEFKNRSTEH